MIGKVFLVGGGPGDPGLLTLRGAECLRRADVVLYDGLVNSAILSHARSVEICHSVGKHGKSRIWSQDEINQRLVAEAQAGKHVVRLKGGDPVVFGRLAEECEALRKAGIEFEIVPGITAALAAGGFAGIPITHRGFASAVALVTGHEEDEKTQSSIDWQALARFPGTIVVYMGVTTVQQWTGELLKAGMDPQTPAAIVRRCSWPDQEIQHATLVELTDRLTPATKLRPPVIVILGRVVQLQPALDWVSRRPLWGQTVIVTRPEHQATELSTPLRELGAQVLFQPAITIGPPEDLQPLDEILDRLEDFQWIVFSSANGVRALIERLLARGEDVRRLGASQIACVGSATRDALTSYYLRADVVPDDFHADSLARSLAPLVGGQQALLVRASRGRDTLAEQLRAAYADVTQVVAYDHRDVHQAEPEILAAIDEERVDWITVTSSAIANSLVNMLSKQRLRRVKLASISPLTSGTLREIGLEVATEASQATMPGLVEAILRSSR